MHQYVHRKVGDGEEVGSCNTPNGFPRFDVKEAVVTLDWHESCRELCDDAVTGIVEHGQVNTGERTSQAHGDCCGT